MSSFLAIDLKSFYASVECRDRNLDPLAVNLVVADESRTEKTICLAVSPALKQYGIPGRARLFEVVERVKNINAERKRRAPNRVFTGKSYVEAELASNPSLALDYLIASPRMARYMQVSTSIYNIYLRFIAPEDIHVYSVDEVFIDATKYLRTYGMTPRELAAKLIGEVMKETGITATAGIGTNLYLAKIAMDVEAKHIPPDENGVRIAELDEKSYREKCWNHTPITDFWRVGKGISKRLSKYGVRTMGDLARLSMENEELLYREFGINAELLIDHAWGCEPCRMEDIKSYRAESNSISSGQVLSQAYPFEKGRLVVREMTDLLVLDLVEKHLVTDQIELTVGYDVSNLNDDYNGPVEKDFYGRPVPKPAHGTLRLGHYTSSTRQILAAMTELYERIVLRDLTVRRMYVVALHVIAESEAEKKQAAVGEQLDMFTDYDAKEKEECEKKTQDENEKKLQHTVIDLKKRFGKNAVLKGMNFEEGATARERNGQVGGHKA